MSHKFYAVKIGRNPGVYSSWDECKAQVSGFPNALFKSFSSCQEAESWLAPPSSLPLFDDIPADDSPRLTAFTDGSFLDGIPAVSYGVFLVAPDGSQTELSGTSDEPWLLPYRNVSGEILAVKKAVQFAKDNGFDKLLIVCDYVGLAEWASGSWKTKSPVSQDFRIFLMQARFDGLDISFQTVRGHSGVFGNERADALAYEALVNYSHA